MQANSTHLLSVVELSLLVFDELCMSLLVTACTVKGRVSVVAGSGGGANKTQTEVYLNFSFQGHQFLQWIENKVGQL